MKLMIFVPKQGISREYIYTFSTIVTDGSPANWNQDIFRSINHGRLENLLVGLDQVTNGLLRGSPLRRSRIKKFVQKQQR